MAFRVKINQSHWLEPIIETVDSMSINADVQFGTTKVCISMPSQIPGGFSRGVFDLAETTIEILP